MPGPGVGEILVRVAYAGVNPIDVMTRTGGGVAGLLTLPFTPGWDLAGTVEALGSQVSTLAVGDRVFGMARFPREGAAYAQHATVPAVDLARTPDTLTDAAAAALPLAAMTAWQAFADTTTSPPATTSSSPALAAASVTSPCRSPTTSVPP